MLLINLTTFDMSAQSINFTCYIACLLLSSAFCMRKNTYELFKNSNGWHRFDEQFISLFNVSRVQCTGYCDQRLNCLSINYNSNLKECELTETYPVESSTSYASETGWRTYFSYTAVYGDRNMEIHFLVSRTRHDVDNDVRTMCARYIGPPSDLRVPATITCGTFTYDVCIKLDLNYGYIEHGKSRNNANT